MLTISASQNMNKYSKVCPKKMTNCGAYPTIPSRFQALKTIAFKLARGIVPLVCWHHIVQHFQISLTLGEKWNQNAAFGSLSVSVHTFNLLASCAKDLSEPTRPGICPCLNPQIAYQPITCLLICLKFYNVFHSFIFYMCYPQRRSPYFFMFEQRYSPQKSLIAHDSMEDLCHASYVTYCLR